MAHYRLILGTKPDLSADRRKKISGKIKDLVTEAGGKIGDTKSRGLIKLAYPIEGSTEASFSTIFFNVPEARTGPLHKELVKIAGVLRAMIIREGVEGQVIG